MLLVNDHAWEIEGANKPENWDFYSVIEPVTYYCRIVGIFPFVLEGPIGNRKYTTSLTGSIYSLFVIVFTIANLIIWTKYGDLEISKQAKYKVILISIQFEITLTILLTVVILASIIIYRKKFSNAIDALSLQDAALRRLGYRFDYPVEYRRNYVRLGSINFVMAVLYIVDFSSQSEYNLLNSLNWLGWICPTFIRIFSSCLFGEILITLNRRFGALNEYLEEMIREKNDLLFEITSNCKRYKMCMRLRSIATIHEIFCETALSLNEIFSISIVVEVIQVVITLITNSYHILYEIEQPHHNYLTILGCINWGIINSGHVLYIIIVCSVTENQASLTGKLIHKFKVNETDTQLNAVIHSFSLQLQHERIEFSGAGLFPLNASLIHSVVGAVTTYLVILIQFDARVFDNVKR